MDDIFVTALYCDDIRQEVGGKHSFMGVYNTDLVVPQFPANLPKLWTQISVRFPLDSKVHPSNLTLRVLMNYEQLTEVVLPEGELSKAIANALTVETETENRNVTVVLGLQFAPLQLEAPGVMRVRAIVDGRELKGNGLRFRLPTEAEQALLPTPQAVE